MGFIDYFKYLKAMKHFNSLSHFRKARMMHILYAGVVFTCISCGGQKSNMDDHGNVAKQDSVVMSNDIESKDTIDIESWLQNTEQTLNEVKNIHINSVSDTLKYSALGKEFKDNSSLVIRDFNPEELTHSVKVRYLKVCLSLFEEMGRIHKESVNVGLRGFLNEDELKSVQEGIELYKKKLWQETH